MILSQCIKRRTSVNSWVFIIMIVAKIIFLFPPLLLLANAQGGGRFGFFSRPDFRRPRPWERPTVAPVLSTPDTPMPTEKITEHVTDSPRARTDLTTITPVRINSGAPISSASRLPPHGRVWARPVFGPRPTAMTTPAAITPTESITIKADSYSPMVSVVSPTTESEGYPITPSTRVPFVDNHAKYKDPSNFNSRGRYSPQLTHNNEELRSDSIKTTTGVPLTTQIVTEPITEQTTTPAEDYSPTVSSTSTTTESVKYTIAPTTEVPFINNHIKYNESLNENLGSRSPPQASLHINDHTTELRTIPVPLTTPRTTFVPTRAPSFNPRSRYPPYMSHNLNVPTTVIRPQSNPGDYLRTSSTTTVATTELPSSTTASAGYTIAPSTIVPFIDEHKKYNDIYLTTKTPVPFQIVTTELAPATTDYHNPIYQENPNNQGRITKEPELSPTTTPNAVTRPTVKATTEPEEYIITTKTTLPSIDVHKEYNIGFTSQPPVKYTNGYEKTSEAPSKSEDYNTPIYPVYHHEADEVSQNKQYSPSTREPEGYTVATTTKVPFIDIHKTYDVSFTSAPPVEYTNGYDRTTGMPNSDETDDFIHNIYENNHKENNNEQSWTPKIVTTTQSALAYKYRYPKTTTTAAVTQTIRHTNSFRYVEPATKATTRYSTTTLRTAHVNKVYDIDNFKCKDEDGYYSISNQCDDFIECKSGFPIQNTCPDGLHFNPAAKYAEFPCAYPSEVKCDSNSVIRQAEPTSECPRRYGYFSLQDGSCDKYIMCQEGLATVMSCPPGLAFSVATSSCDWPANVPDCLPDVFQGFTCPAPELNEDGQPTHSIYKYRYEKSCKKYIACQKGHPRLLSCDTGLAFDENSESCIDEFDVDDCT